MYLKGKKINLRAHRIDSRRRGRGG